MTHYSSTVWRRLTGRTLWKDAVQLYVGRYIQFSGCDYCSVMFEEVDPSPSISGSSVKQRKYVTSCLLTLRIVNMLRGRHNKES